MVWTRVPMEKSPASRTRVSGFFSFASLIRVLMEAKPPTSVDCPSCTVRKLFRWEWVSCRNIISAVWVSACPSACTERQGVCRISANARNSVKYRRLLIKEKCFFVIKSPFLPAFWIRQCKIHVNIIGDFREKRNQNLHWKVGRDSVRWKKGLERGKIRRGRTGKV